MKEPSVYTAVACRARIRWSSKGVGMVRRETAAPKVVVSSARSLRRAGCREGRGGGVGKGLGGLMKTSPGRE